MDRLSVKTFIRAAGDLELSHYQILGSLKSYTNNLHSNMLYPAYDDLREVVYELEAILEQRSKINFSCASEFSDMKSDNGLPIFETSEDYEDEICKMFEIIKWSLPQLKECLTEAEAIYQFVYKEINIKELGIVPLYKKEGYFVMPDNRENTFYFYRYEDTFLHLEDSNSGILKCTLIDFENDEPKKEINIDGLKLELLNRFHDLPNPATFIIDSELDFPFSETMLPVAKQKLKQHLAK